MKIKEHIKLFFCDHLWILILFAFSILMISYSFGKINNDLKSVLYYTFLSIFCLIIALTYRFYATWNLYQLYLLEINDITDILINNPKSCSEKYLSYLNKKIYLFQLKKNMEFNNKQKLRNIMIYKWVHQIKTPVSVINLIVDANSESEEMNKIKKQLINVQYDLNQLLSMSRLDNIKSDFTVEKINLYELVKEIINNLKNSFIYSEVFPDLNIEKDINILSDKKWLSFAVYQILTNAIKYSEKGSKVFIKASTGEKFVSLHIKDCGCGILKKDINKIFDLFFTGTNGRDNTESSGLGLYMCKEALDYLGHEIKVDSNVNVGSIFTINFKL